MSIDYPQLFLSSVAVAFVLSVLLVAKSIMSFSRTGPAIRDEILQRYATYTVYALGRLAVFAFLLMLWMGLIGSTLSLVAAALLHIPTGLITFGTGAIIGIGLISSLQFCKHLLLIPSGIMMSSNYSMRRFLPLHRLLTVRRLRRAELAILAVMLIAVVKIYASLPETASARSGFLVFVTMLALPYLLSIAPKLLLLAAPRAHDAKHMNLLMIGSDTLRADHVGARHKGQPLTPFIDSLAKQGTLFSNCLVSIARTAPALVSIFTGTLPNTNGVKLNFMADEQTRISQQGMGAILARQGYATEAITDWAGSDLAKFPLGFHRYDGPPDQWNLKFLIRQGPKDLRLFLTLFTHNYPGKLFLPETYFLAGKPMTNMLGDSVRIRLNSHIRSRKPFFLNAFLSTTHPPFGSEYPYYQHFTDTNYHGESRFGMSRLTDPVEIIRSQKEPREAFDLDQILDLYKGCVRNFDDEVRKIVSHLRKTGLDRNTLMVIYSDHGTAFFEDNTWGQGNSIHSKTSNRIPLLIIDPRRPGRPSNEQVVRSIDIMPTLLELLGMEIPDTVDGTSLKPLLDGEPLPDLPGFCETGLWLATPPGQHPDHIRYPELLDLLDIADLRTGTLSLRKEYETVVEAGRDRMLELGEWRLLRIALNGEAAYELYHLPTDPDCQQNVADRYPEQTASLATELKRMIDRKPA